MHIDKKSLSTLGGDDVIVVDLLVVAAYVDAHTSVVKYSRHLRNYDVTSSACCIVLQDPHVPVRFLRGRDANLLFFFSVHI